ncbi:MAG: PAS domain S-box protein [Bryobacteraceae bacterium]|nr:PAS domain S-box protein [Bryobacteraceae bacterium]
MPNVVPAPDHWRAAVEHLGAFAVCSMDAEGQFVLWNDGAAKLFGYTPAEALGKSIRELFTPAERESGLPEALLQEARTKGAAAVTRNLLQKDGAIAGVEGALSRIESQSGVLSGYSLVVRSAPDSARVQTTIERLSSELHQFAFTVSHDMKAPLRSVKSFSELLQRRYKGKLDDDADEYIGFIVDGARQMEQLITDVLAYSQAGREDKTRLQTTDAAGVLQWALMNVDAAAKQSGAAITWDPLPSVMADQSQLAHVFQHLLNNAMKFRSEAPPRIHVSSRDATGEMTEISVSDNGIGVDPVYFERIFGIFKRLHGPSVPGTGIGLAISRKIVEAHGGRIWIESGAGQGSTFRFTLPLA